VRKLAITLVTGGTFALAATALASLPQKGHFAGKTSARSINGFKDGVTFIVINNGRTLHDFSFGTLGCFGTITISQTYKTDKCGPAKMTFTAAPGTADDSSNP
jgi:hypothetical protein